MALKKTIVLPLLLTLLLAAPRPSSSDRAYLEKICPGTDHTDVCLSMLDPAGIQCTDLPCAAQAASNVAQQRTKDILNSITALRAKGPPPDVDTALDVCQDVYANAATSLGKITQELANKQYTDAWNDIGGRQSDPEQCETNFPTHPSVATPFNKQYEDMIDVVFVLIDQIVSI